MKLIMWHCVKCIFMHSNNFTRKIILNVFLNQLMAANNAKHLVILRTFLMFENQTKCAKKIQRSNEMCFKRMNKDNNYRSRFEN